MSERRIRTTTLSMPLAQLEAVAHNKEASQVLPHMSPHLQSAQCIIRSCLALRIPRLGMGNSQKAGN